MQNFNYFILLFFIFTNGSCAKIKMNVAIIGAGPAGLLSGKYCLDANFTCNIYEKTGRVGGVWVYTDKTDLDDYGLPVHSSMYKGLKTNLPKEVMQFNDFPYPAEIKKSFLTQPEVLQYFENFTEKYHLYDHIKFYSNVTLIKSIEDEKWLVKSFNVKNKTNYEKVYDAVIVCNGHFEKPFMPNLKGIHSFNGMQMHSHYYRSPEKFIGKNVLVIGGGPSGTDISGLISEKAAKVYLSAKTLWKKPSDSVILKPPIKEVFEKIALFEDGSEVNFDAILYCTGFQYSFDFLDKSCSIEVIQGKWVKPLYKQIINIEHPSMGFIGIPYGVAVIPSIEIQIRFYVSYLTGHFQIQSKEEMLKEFNEEVLEKQKAMKYPRHMHLLGGQLQQKKYFDDLAITANISKVPNVINEIYGDVRKYQNFNALYRIIDDEHFEKTFPC